MERLRHSKPLGTVSNQRSFVYAGNLILIIVAAEHSRAAGEKFTIRDGEDTSTDGTVPPSGAGAGTMCWVMPFPAPLLKFGATILGRRDVGNRLIDSLQVDFSKPR